MRAQTLNALSRVNVRHLYAVQCVIALSSLSQSTTTHDNDTTRGCTIAPRYNLEDGVPPTFGQWVRVDSPKSSTRINTLLRTTSVALHSPDMTNSEEGDFLSEFRRSLHESRPT